VGLFIALIGFRNSGIVVPSPATTVTLGNLADPSTLLAIFGLILIAALLAWRIRGHAHWHSRHHGRRAGDRRSQVGAAAILAERSWRHAGKLDIAAALRIGLVEIVFVFLFIDLFDNLGTLVAVGTKAKLFDRATTFHGSTESCSPTPPDRGWLAGWHVDGGELHRERGRRGCGRAHGNPAIVTGLLFVVALFVAPIVERFPRLPLPRR